jgi:hypothetical protein
MDVRPATEAFIDEFTRVVQLVTAGDLDQGGRFLAGISRVGKVPGKKLRADRVRAIDEVGVVPRRLGMPHVRHQAEIFVRRACR